MNRSRAESDRPSAMQTVLRWFDSEAGPDQETGKGAQSVDWLRILPLALLHVMCLGVIWVGWSPAAILTAVFLYLLRMFAITINSLDHMFGTRRYETNDTSRNNWLLALITLGEGWHNNHHHYAVSARQGFFWWEIDITYYLLKLMARFGIISDLRPVPEAVRRPANVSEKG